MFKCICTRIYRYLCIYICICICVYAWVCCNVVNNAFSVYVCMGVCIYLCVFVYMYIYLCQYICVCMCGCWFFYKKSKDVSAPELRIFKMYMCVHVYISVNSGSCFNYLYCKSVNSRESKFDLKIEEPAFDPLPSVCL